VEGLQRLVLTFKPEGVEARALYKTQGGPGPSTKARRREVVEFTRAGLQRALEALEGDVEDLGTSGFTTREDTIFVEGKEKAA
jgi:hypothetical protein